MKHHFAVLAFVYALLASGTAAQAEVVLEWYGHEFHLSEMGHLPSEATFEAVGRVDVVLVPVGGNLSIDGRQARQIVERLSPRIAIPIHYKTAATARWPIEDERAFVDGYPWVKRVAGSRINLNPGTLPPLTELWVLEPPTEWSAR